jgi:hypothetical protein
MGVWHQMQPANSHDSRRHRMGMMKQFKEFAVKGSVIDLRWA